MREIEPMPSHLRAIPDLPDYAAEATGTIWSRYRWGWWRPLKPYVKVNGRYMVSVWTPTGQRKVMQVHRLVLAAFVGPCPDGMEACHNDGDPSNNRPENLRWDTRVSNMADTLTHGTRNHGEVNGKSKISAETVGEIRRRLAASESQRSIARAVGLTQPQVSNIHRGKSWGHLSPTC